VAACHAAGVPVLVDGAHAPGALPLALDALGADWYVGNLHKWAMAPRGTGVLCVGRDAAERAVRAPGRALHPAVISWGLDQGLSQEFDWTGTRDPSGWLCAPAGLGFMRDTLGLAAMRDWNHTLAMTAAQALSRAWCGQDWAVPEACVGSMVTVRLPAALSEALGGGPDGATRVKDALLFDHGIEAQVLAIRGQLALRWSAQVYNEAADIERLLAAVDAIGRRPG